VKAQTGLTTVKTTNSGSSVTVQFELETVAYTVTQDGFLCSFKGTGNKTDGKYSSDVTMSRVGGGSVSVGEGGGPTETTLSTSLSGEGKEGEAITVNEGSKVKDTATLSGANASKATGTVKYKVYADSSCKELVTSAGEVTVTSGSVPNSSEIELTAGAVYYWQAEYSGDSNNLSSVSVCSKEVLTVKAATTLSTSLSGGGKEGEAITVDEGTKVKDTATLSGTKSSTATGKAKYKVYSDSKCEKLVTEAGEVTVSEGKVPASEEKTLTAAAVYYWQAEYAGDSLHQASKSTCGKEVLTVKALVSIATVLAGVDAEGETVEGEEISVPAGTAVVDTATLSGTAVSGATGTLEYFVYSDEKCEELVAEAGEVTVAGASVPSSEALELEPGTYYWVAEYSGDALHKGSTGTCGDEIARAIAPTSLATELAGEGKEAAEIEVAAGAAVSDTAELSGENASEASGTVEYSVYSDLSCEELVAEAGEVTVSGGTVPASTPQTLEPGLYFWKAEYSGDSSNYPSRSDCGEEILVVTPRITTELTGGGLSGEAIVVPEGTLVSDSATLHGGKATEATGTLEYFVYSDEKCEELVAEAGEVTVAGASVPSSEALELEPGTYYWVAEYSGDVNNPAATSACGSEMVVVVTPTSLTTTLTGGVEEGAEIEVDEGTAVSDTAELSGANAATAEGSVSYVVYGDSECTEVVELAGNVDVNEGSVPASDEVALPAGTYYWQASYSGDGVNQDSTGACGAEIEVVTAGITTMLTSGEESGTELEVDIGAAVTDAATLHGPNASEATGTVEYFVYGDNQCEELVAEAGEVEVEGASVPASSAVELESPGVYYWQAVYSGDGKNPPATSTCGTEELVVADAIESIYAALGDSFSAGHGLVADGGTYYQATDVDQQPKVHTENRCHRGSLAWPALIANKKFGGGVVVENAVFSQTPANFIFRACSGATTDNLLTTGQYDEWISNPAAKWLPKPAQNLWLTTPGGEPKGKANDDISTVTLTIGGNDAGFANIARRCIQAGALFKYDPAPCQTEIAKYEKTFAAIQAKIVAVLEDIKAKAPKARIAVPIYPSILFLNGTDIHVGTNTKPINVRLYVNDTVAGANNLTAAASLEGFIINLNHMIRTAVDEAGDKKVNVKTVEGTYAAFMNGHRLNEAKPWVHGVLTENDARQEESFHPNRCGHQSLAAVVFADLEPNGAPPALCP
jgi:lysophospholipase L1-like esterase